ncbi:DUF4184 family protein [Muribacter muris]|uniref:DUF4184 family protein n=1 Tax=Muribacter muris TaxID=67855 RepID=UPI00064DE8EF|nr:DUF4184 family protein [Muribacter muris]
MPFTLAHPVAVLCFPRNRYFHFPALVLGAMSPDFIYFLYGQPVNCGHKIFGSEWQNLSLSLLFYGVYRFLLAKPLKQYLPKWLASAVPQPEAKNPLIWLLIFTYSAWLGMLSHIGLDHFTHHTGYFVQQFPILQQVYALPIYKWLQYGGGVLGLTAIVIYQWRMATKYPYLSTKNSKQKAGFWLFNLALTLASYGIWHNLQPLAWAKYANQIIRLIDCAVIALILQSLLWAGLNALQKRRRKRPLAR